MNQVINDNRDVVLLSRKNSLPWYINYSDQGNSSIESGLDRFLELLRARLPKELAERVTILTTHKHKGLQEDVVIVLDAVHKCYPLIHPNLIFTRVFGDSVEGVVAEERRLFYVALTRAVKNLFILTETNNFSLFLEALEIDTLEWSNYPPLITIRVGNQRGGRGNGTYAIKELLRTDGYDWNARTRVWESVETAEEFSVRKFANQARWSHSADGIQVGFYDYLDNAIARYHVDGGQWNRIFDNIYELDD